MFSEDKFPIARLENADMFGFVSRTLAPADAETPSPPRCVKQEFIACGVAPAASQLSNAEGISNE